MPLIPRAQIASAAMAFATTVGYLIIIWRQDHHFGARPVFIATFLVVIAAVIVWGARASNVYLRAGLLSGGGNSLILVGFLGLFSIGLPLLIAGVISLPATARALAQTPRPWGPVIVGLSSALGVLVIVVGILATA
jgi:hypothetical protein